MSRPFPKPIIVEYINDFYPDSYYVGHSLEINKEIWITCKPHHYHINRQGDIVRVPVSELQSYIRTKKLDSILD